MPWSTGAHLPTSCPTYRSPACSSTFPSPTNLKDAIKCDGGHGGTIRSRGVCGFTSAAMPAGRTIASYRRSPPVSPFRECTCGTGCHGGDAKNHDRRRVRRGGRRQTAFTLAVDREPPFPVSRSLRLEPSVRKSDPVQSYHFLTYQSNRKALLMRAREQGRQERPDWQHTPVRSAPLPLRSTFMRGEIRSNAPNPHLCFSSVYGIR